MSFWTAVVAIVLIGAIASVLRARYNASAGITEDMMGNQTINPPPRDTEREAEAEREIAALKDRIKVLERIATDPAHRTAREIEQLRDQD